LKRALDAVRLIKDLSEEFFALTVTKRH